MLEYEYDSNLHAHRFSFPFLPLSLSEILDRTLHADLIQSIIFQSINALAHLHTSGVAHRDINPNNIMIDWDGTVQLIDLGLAWTGGDDDKDDKVWLETQQEMICDVGTGYVLNPKYC